MNRRILILVYLLVVSLVLCGFEGKVLLGDYKTKNIEKEKIIAALISYEKAYNEHDLERLLSCCSEKAKLTPCGEAWLELSKKDYAKKFPLKWQSYPNYIFFNPKITRDGNQAELKLQLITGYWLVDYKINMIKEKDEWLILKTSYSNPRSKNQ